MTEKQFWMKLDASLQKDLQRMRMTSYGAASVRSRENHISK